MSSTCPFDPSLCGATLPRTHQFSRVRQRSRNGKVAGEKETISRRLYVHVYYSPDNEAKKELAFRKNLLELKAQIEEGETDQLKHIKAGRARLLSRPVRLREKFILNLISS